MIGNDLYTQLKSMKQDDSFTAFIKGLLERKESKQGSSLKACLGLLSKDDKEYAYAMKTERLLFKKWTKKYA